MATYVVSFARTTHQTLPTGEKLMYTEVATEEVVAARYVPLPQKVVNFYDRSLNGEIVATFYDVVSVTVKAKQGHKPGCQEMGVRDCVCHMIK